MSLASQIGSVSKITLDSPLNPKAKKAKDDVEITTFGNYLLVVGGGTYKYRGNFKNAGCIWKSDDPKGWKITNSESNREEMEEIVKGIKDKTLKHPDQESKSKTPANSKVPYQECKVLLPTPAVGETVLLDRNAHLISDVVEDNGFVWAFTADGCVFHIRCGKWIDEGEEYSEIEFLGKC